MSVPEFSQMLTERRRQLGYSVGQAARALRLKESVLEAFESGDFASMPKSGYAQGMLSSYARFLGLDAQLVTDLFAESLDEWRAQSVRGSSRQGSRSSRSRQAAAGSRRGAQRGGQPQVPRRGLLPTSGGIAGDLGDYATTSQVRPHAYGRPHGMGEPSQGRGYGSARDSRASDEALRRRGRSGGRDDVTTVPVSSEYVDDLRFGNDARAYDPASSESGRASYRNLASTERPQVQRRPSSRQRQQVRGRGRQKPRTFAERLVADPVRFIALIVVLVAVIITLILLLAISSCSFGMARRDDDKSVPVSQTTTNSTTANSSSASNNANDKSEQEAAAERQIASASANTGDGEDNTATVVEVSVADGSVTWLEIECDGSSKVAETVTGPWDQTYTVTESITIQVGDTTAVTVTKNGKQMQFDSRASGLGTMTIRGTKVETPQTSAAAGTNSTRTTTANGSDATNGSDAEGASGSANASGSTAKGSSTGSGSDASGSPSSAGTAASSGAAAYGSSSGSGGGSSSSAGTGSSGTRSSASLGRAGASTGSDAATDDSSGYDGSGDYYDSDSAY